MITTFFPSGFTTVQPMSKPPRRRGAVRWHDCVDHVEDMMRKCDPAWVLSRTIRLEALLFLVWDYLDTVCNLAAMEGRQETKQTVRHLRKLCRDEWATANATAAMTETRIAIADQLRTMLDEDFTKLYYGVDTELNRAGHKDGHKDLMMAVYQFLALAGAVKRYSERMSALMKKWDVHMPALMLSSPRLPDAVAHVALLVADDIKYSKASGLTAKILANRLESEERADSLLMTADRVLGRMRPLKLTPAP